jgi:hypothetical protein
LERSPVEGDDKLNAGDLLRVQPGIVGYEKVHPGRGHATLDNVDVHTAAKTASQTFLPGTHYNFFDRELGLRRMLAGQ